MVKSKLLKSLRNATIGAGALVVGAGTAYADHDPNDDGLYHPGNYTNSGVSSVESRPGSSVNPSWRLDLGVEHDGDRGYFRVGSDWRLGNSNSRLGFYLRKASDEGEAVTDSSSEITATDIELVGPGVYRERTDYEQTDTERKLGDMEYGVQFILGYPSWGLVARLGATKEKTTEQKTLSSTVRFLDAPGGTEIDTEATNPTVLTPTQDEKNVPVLEVGGQYVWDSGWNVGASAHAAFREDGIEVKPRITFGWSW